MLWGHCHFGFLGHEVAGVWKAIDGTETRKQRLRIFDATVAGEGAKFGVEIVVRHGFARCADGDAVEKLKRGAGSGLDDYPSAFGPRPAIQRLSREVVVADHSDFLHKDVATQPS